MSSTKQKLRHNATGRLTLVAALAGLIGLVLAIAVAASMLMAPAQAHSGLQPGYFDHGQRHPEGVPAPRADRPDSRLDDYGIRCVVTGWCAQPASDDGTP